VLGRCGAAKKGHSSVCQLAPGAGARHRPGDLHRWWERLASRKIYNQTRSCGDASAEAPEKISWWMGARTRCLKCPDEVNPGSAISCVRGHAKSASDDGSVAGDTR